jgi:hypothetical protein
MLRSTHVLADETAAKDGFDGAAKAVKGLPAGASAAFALASVPASGSSRSR